MFDMHFMQLAISEAARIGWKTHPNPMVGAVIVRNGEVVAKGYHHGAGKPHAEVEALADAAAHGIPVAGADMYVTLEPCNHYGKTPPCTEALIKAGIANVYIGTPDPDSRVHGSGIARLREAGIRCEVGFCQEELFRLNAAFFKRVSTGLPYVTLKWAMTMDGHITARDGSSKWITGETARKHVHEQRAIHDAIMVGTGTACADNPALTVRLEDPNIRQPLRVILDRNLRIPRYFQVFDTKLANTVLFTSQRALTSGEGNADAMSFFALRGIPVECVAEVESGLDVEAILRLLVSKYGITTVYCEGGSGLSGTLCDKGLADSFWVYVAPKVVGSKQSLCPVGGLGVPQMGMAEKMRLVEVLQLGDDVCLHSVRDNWEKNCDVYGTC